MILEAKHPGLRGLVRAGVAGLAFIALVGVFSSSVKAGEAMTRAAYVPRAEAVCRATAVRHKAVLRGVSAMVRKHELKAAAKRLRIASRALQHAISRLAAIPRPPADRQRLAQWLAHGRSGRRLLQRMAERLAGGSSAGLSAMANHLLREVRRANAIVVGFEFHYCRIDPANFT